MGCVQQAVLEFDEEVQAPWRPRLVPAADGAGEAARESVVRARPVRSRPSRVGACRPPKATVRPGGERRAQASRTGARAETAGGPPNRRRPERRAVPGGPGAARLRLTRRARRLAVVLMLAAGVALGSWLGPLISGGDGGALRLAGVSSVVVEPGDTLWSIASSLSGDGDVRVLIDEIQELNSLTGSDLVPGQTLQLP